MSDTIDPNRPLEAEDFEGEVLTITKEELNKLDTEDLPLSPVVLNEKSKRKEIEAACKQLRERGVIGFDTETKPSFKKGGSHHPVALLQLATDRVVVLVRLIRIKDFTEPKWMPLRRLLASPNILKVGVGIHDDGLGLAKDYGLITNKTLDLRSLAKADGMDVLSLTKIYSLLFGKRLSKGQRLSDWEKPELSGAQMEYAGLDAFAGYQIYDKLKHLATPQMVTKKLYGEQKPKAYKKPENRVRKQVKKKPRKGVER